MDYLYDCINELNKPLNIRNSNIIIKYIKSLSPFMSLMNHEIKKNPSHLENTVKIFHYIKKEKNEIIVKEGEKGDEFFLILKGKVAILVLEPKYYYMTEEEYILHLLKLKQNNENECIKQTIIQNQLIYPIEENFDILLEELIGRKTKQGNYLYNEKIILKANDVYLKIKDNKNKKNIMSPEEYININEVDNSIIENNNNLFDDKGNKKNKVLIMSYQLINYFETGQTFGEVALQNLNHKRIATVISVEDSHIVFINRNEYNSFIKNSIERNIKKFYSIIDSFNLFNDVSRYIFDKNYFNFFIYKKINKGNFLINQNEKCKDIYFIFNGEFEVYTIRNIFEVNNLLISYKKKLVNLNPESRKEYNYDDEEKENDDLIINKKFKTEESNKILFQKRKIILGILAKREIVGFSDCCFIFDKNEKKRKSYLYCKCISLYGEAYNISQEFFDKMIKYEIKVLKLKEKYEIKKLKLYIEILQKHKKRIYDKIQFKNNEISKQFYLKDLKDKNLHEKNRLYTFENNAKILKENLKINSNEYKTITTKNYFNNLNKYSIKKTRNRNNSDKLPKIIDGYSKEIIDKNPNYIHKYKKNNTIDDTYRITLTNRNLYDNIFHSYVTLSDKNFNSVSDFNNLKQSNNHYRSLSQSISDKLKNKKNIKLKKYSFKKNKEANIYDMLIFDKFNSCFNQALRTFSIDKSKTINK